MAEPASDSELHCQWLVGECDASDSESSCDWFVANPSDVACDQQLVIVDAGCSPRELVDAEGDAGQLEALSRSSSVCSIDLPHPRRRATSHHHLVTALMRERKA